jgi:hypothetical protein
MIKANNTKKKAYRHGNCVPFILTNVKTGTIVYKASLLEIADRLKITPQHASTIGQSGKPYKNKFTIQRMGFNTLINLS